VASSTVLITGAGGYLGRRIARSFLERGDEVVLWMRADHQRTSAIAGELAAFSDRIRFAHGDLDDEVPFAEVDARTIQTVVHTAAVTHFNVERELAEQVNVKGLGKLVAWARSCPNLSRLSVLSTVYSHGLHEGILTEELLHTPPEFANHYERSKWQAERLLSEEAADLPWQIQRVSTVIADDETGCVGQHNAFHNTLKLLYYGLLSVVPGNPGTPLYFVTADFVAEAVRELSLRGTDQAVYHVSHSRSESATLEQLLDVACECFERDPAFRKRRILRPLLCDAEAFDSLAASIESFGGAVVSQSLKSVAPFAPQLFTDKTIANDRLVAALPSCRAPDALEGLGRACTHLVASRWGKAEVLCG